MKYLISRKIINNISMLEDILLRKGGKGIYNMTRVELT